VTRGRTSPAPSPAPGAPVRVSLPRRLWTLFSTKVVLFYAMVLNRLTVEGADHIPASGGVLFAANHISAFDTLFLPSAVWKFFPLKMVWAPAKEELFRNRVAGAIFRSWGAFPVKRGRDVRAAQTVNGLLETEKVMIFPEGTRHRDGVLGAGNRGVGKIILDVRPAVIPTALVNLHRWRFPRLGQRGKIVFGEPLDVSDLLGLEDGKETHVLITGRLMSAIGALLIQHGHEAPPPSTGGRPPAAPRQGETWSSGN
jgi:1-acyl-sn-glycerol-3-phosphate acyltransferase